MRRLPARSATAESIPLANAPGHSPAMNDADVLKKDESRVHLQMRAPDTPRVNEAARRTAAATFDYGRPACGV
jgi:hypothetical protein